METWRFIAAGDALFAHFSEQGFAVIENVLDETAVERLLQAIEPAAASDTAHVRADGTYALRNLLRTVPAVRELAASQELRRLVEPVLGGGAFPVKGILFDKTPGANWKVPWHQDTTICVRERADVPGFGPWTIKDGALNVQPPAAVLSGIMTIRLHLDDCGPDAGALLVLPGSHRAGRLDAAGIADWRERVPPVLCTARHGGAVLMRPLTLHASAKATSPRHRRVVHLEFSASALPGGLAWTAVGDHNRGHEV